MPALLALTAFHEKASWVTQVNLRNGLIFGFSAIALLFLVMLLGNVIWYHIGNVALRLAAVTLLLLILASVIQVLYLILIHRYRVNI